MRNETHSIFVGNDQITMKLMTLNQVSFVVFQSQLIDRYITFKVEKNSKRRRNTARNAINMYESHRLFTVFQP